MKNGDKIWLKRQSSSKEKQFLVEGHFVSFWTTSKFIGLKYPKDDRNWDLIKFPKNLQISPSNARGEPIGFKWVVLPG